MTHLGFFLTSKYLNIKLCLMPTAQKRYELVSQLREFFESKGGPNWRTDPLDLPINFAGVTDTTILVDVTKADRAWSQPKHINFRISRQGQNEIGDRTQKLVDWIKSGGDLEPPDVYYSRDSKGLDFSDGRHRFSLLRDVGVLVIPMNSDSPESLMDLEAVPHEVESYLKQEQSDKDSQRPRRPFYNPPRTLEQEIT